MSKECFFNKYLSDSEWLIQECTYDPSLEPVNASLFTLGNGYIGSRGIYEERSKHSSSGTFFAGVYEESLSKVAELINAPNPFHIAINIQKFEKLDVSMMSSLQHKRILDLKKAMLFRHTVFKTQNNHLYDYQSMRFISQHNLNVAVMQVKITALTDQTHLIIDGTIDTDTKNHGIVMERDTQDFRIQSMETQGNCTYLLVESLDFGKQIAYGQQIELNINGNEEGIFSPNFDFYLEKGETATITKFITFFVARTVTERKNVKTKVMRTLAQAVESGVDHLVKQHAKTFAKSWQQINIDIVGDIDVATSLRFNLYHLLIAANVKVKDASIGAKLLTGEGYKGHVFWETELLLLPCYLYSKPKQARKLLEYRYNRLDAAKELAASRGFKGALYPWESAGTGKDETPAWSESLDESTIEIVHTGKKAIHINLAIFHAIDLYFCATHDVEFMLMMGMPMIIEMARFWKSRAMRPKGKSKFELHDMMGPDEFHYEAENNVYTNGLLAWSLRKTLAYYDYFESNFPSEENSLLKALNFTSYERNQLKKIADNIVINEQDKILLQFDNYLDLEFHRLPSLDVYGLPKLPSYLLVTELVKTQFIKQADVVLLLLLLPFCYDRKLTEANYYFYLKRTLHKSSWSPPIYSAVAAQIGNVERAYHYFAVTLNTDKKNIFGNSEQGLHAPAVAGAWIAIIYGFCGVRIADDRIIIAPNLPGVWQSAAFNFHYLDFLITIIITPQEVKLSSKKAANPWLINQSWRKPLLFATIQIADEVIQIFPDHEYVVPYRRPLSYFDSNYAPQK